MQLKPESKRLLTLICHPVSSLPHLHPGSHRAFYGRHSKASSDPASTPALIHPGEPTEAKPLSSATVQGCHPPLSRARAYSYHNRARA